MRIKALRTFWSEGVVRSMKLESLKKGADDIFFQFLAIVMWPVNKPD
jgi:nitrate reductase NapE component